MQLNLIQLNGWHENYTLGRKEKSEKELDLFLYEGFVLHIITYFNQPDE